MDPPPFVTAMALTAQQNGLASLNQLPQAPEQGSGAQAIPASQSGSKRPRTDGIDDPSLQANVPAPADNVPQVDNTAARQLHWFNIKPYQEHASFSAEKVVKLTGQDILATIILRMTEIQTELDSGFPSKFEQSTLNTDTIKIDGEEKTFFHIQASFTSKAHVDLLVNSGPITVHPPLGEDDDGIIYNIAKAQPLSSARCAHTPPSQFMAGHIACLCAFNLKDSCWLLPA